MQRNDDNRNNDASRPFTLGRRSVLAGGAAALAAIASPMRAARAAVRRAGGQDGPRLAHQHRRALARSAAARRHREPGQFPDGAARWPDQELPRPSATIISRSPRSTSSPRTPRARRSGCGRGSSSTTARRSRRPTSSGATSITAAPGARCCTSQDRGRRTGGRPHGPVPLQGAVPRLPDPDGDRQRVRCRLGGSGEDTMSRWARPGSCRSRSAPVPTSWCRRNPA